MIPRIVNKLILKCIIMAKSVKVIHRTVNVCFGIPKFYKPSRLLLFGGIALNDRQSDLLKQPCTLTVNAALSLLTTTLSLLNDVTKEYKEILTKLIALHNECILLNGWGDELWDNVIESRQKLNKIKTEFDYLVTYMDSVDKVVLAAIEVAFNVNAEYLCSVLGENHSVAESKIREITSDIRQLEEGYLNVQRQVTEIPAFQNKK